MAAVPNVRMFPPGDGRHPVGKANGRTYTAAASGFVDVPSHDADVLYANGWTRLGLVGPTSARPATSGMADGTMYIDTSLPAVIAWQTIGAGGVWRNALTGSPA